MIWKILIILSLLLNVVNISILLFVFGKVKIMEMLIHKVADKLVR